MMERKGTILGEMGILKVQPIDGKQAHLPPKLMWVERARSFKIHGKLRAAKNRDK
jgi:hypothetical protein